MVLQQTSGEYSLLLAWCRVAAVFAEMRRRRLARRELRCIDEATMRDIGLSHRAAAEGWLAREAVGKRGDLDPIRDCPAAFAVPDARQPRVIERTTTRAANSRAREAALVIAIAAASVASAVGLVMWPPSSPSSARTLPSCESRIARSSPEGAKTQTPYIEARKNHDTTHPACA